MLPPWVPPPVDNMNTGGGKGGGKLWLQISGQELPVQSGYVVQ